MSDATDQPPKPSEISPPDGAKFDTMDPKERTHRRDSLEKHLQHRPEQQDLKNRHILLDSSAAPSLQQAQHDLERQQASDNLKKGLASRPEKENLIERNILPENSGNVAPSLQASQRDLQRHMRKDSLEKHLQNRPKPDELVREGILEKDEAPVITE